jgi:hypothetical protein
MIWQKSEMIDYLSQNVWRWNRELAQAESAGFASVAAEIRGWITEASRLIAALGH